MAAFARGKLTLQDSFSVMGNSRQSFSTPFHVQKSSLFRIQTRPLSSKPKVTLPSSLQLINSGPSHGTRIIPLLPSMALSESFSTTESPPKKLQVLFPEEVKLDKIKFSEIKKNSKGGNFIAVFYEVEGLKLRVQTPALRVPFDTLKKTDAQTGNPVINFALSLDSKDSEPVKKFIDLINFIDDQVKKVASKNSSVLFPGRQTSQEVFDFQFRTTIRPPKDPTKYSSVVKFRVGQKEGVPYVNIQDYNTRENIPLAAITRNSRVMCLVEPNMVWFVGGQFGISWNLVSIRVLQLGEGSVPEFREMEEPDFR